MVARGKAVTFGRGEKGTLGVVQLRKARKLERLRQLASIFAPFRTTLLSPRSLKQEMQREAPDESRSQIKEARDGTRKRKRKFAPFSTISHHPLNNTPSMRRKQQKG